MLRHICFLFFLYQNMIWKFLYLRDLVICKKTKIFFIFFGVFFFAMFRQKLSILIPDLYLYGIKIQTKIKQNGRKIREKSINFQKGFFLNFFRLGRTRPDHFWSRLALSGLVNNGAVNYSLSTIYFAEQWRSWGKRRRRRKGKGQLNERQFVVVLAAHDESLVGDEAEWRCFCCSSSSSLSKNTSLYLFPSLFLFLIVLPPVLISSVFVLPPSSLCLLFLLSLSFFSLVSIFLVVLCFIVPHVKCAPLFSKRSTLSLHYSLCSSPFSKTISPQFSQKMSPHLPPYSYVIFFLVPLFFISFLLKTISSQNLPVFHFFFSRVSKTISLVPNRPPSFRSPPL